MAYWPRFANNLQPSTFNHLTLAYWPRFANNLQPSTLAYWPRFANNLQPSTIQPSTFTLESSVF
ncbi:MULTISPECIES: hypothetical protein [unclassified Moorena]|uniref:hypothetical protein n=1 Tax=unclassified Moorena TaxID=2683338 RepID=UPI0013CC5943|nr:MULTISPECIES: hypothetical protein [unclassified Moorena]NEO20215.1 hypothetical protein [Moorena sp. SIO4A5]NEP22662.1 hypothetical protein [Moorena sp. SIO3I6]